MTALSIRIMIYDFLIAGLSIRCVLSLDVKIAEKDRRFLSQDSGNAPDLTVNFSPVERLEPLREEGTWGSGFRYYAYPDRYIYDCHHNRDEAPYARVSWDKRCPDRMTCEYTQDGEKQLRYSGGILNNLGIETILLRYRTLLLHSAFISYENMGILFTAPSGTGKSTQANLWKEFEGAQIINGDRAAIRKTNHGWTAWGLPFAGTSGIYRNESAPLAAIVVLRQAEENRIRPLKPVEAMRMVYQELTLHRWEAESVETALDILLELVSSVPVYLLECRPDREAVALLKAEIQKGGFCHGSDSCGTGDNRISS